MAAGNILLLLIFLISDVILPSLSCFSAIFSFSDSLADTGNLLASTDDHIHADQPPYGETYFHRPTGRFSDGRLAINFIAQAMGLPLVPPYLAGSSGQDFRRGVNFAVAGVTAMSDDFFREKGLNVIWANYSLGTQIQLFKKFLPSLSSKSGSMSCEDPSKYIGWDGVHFTEAAYNIIADGWMKGPYAVPSIKSVCSNKAIHLLNQYSI